MQKKKTILKYKLILTITNIYNIKYFKWKTIVNEIAAVKGHFEYTNNVKWQ